MKILLAGSGQVTAKLAVTVGGQGHSIAAMLATFTPNQLDMMDFDAVLIVSPEAQVSTDTLVKAIERGKKIFLLAGAQDGLVAWGASTKVPTFAYPPSDTEVDALLAELRRGDIGTINQDDQYRRAMLGGDVAARLTSHMIARKIAVTSPKGGVGKTSVAVNLAVAYALSGFTTYLIDADGNGGAMSYHLRMRTIDVRSSLILRRSQSTSQPAYQSVMAHAASAGIYYDAFSQVETLPTLKFLPGLITDDLGDKSLQNEETINSVIAGLYDVGVASNGIVIMDVGINPSHPIHRAALRNAEAISIVLKPEIPDMVETQRWISRMIAALAIRSSRDAALQFIGQRVKLCYNMVYGKHFKRTHELLLQALQAEGINLNLVANGILPIVDIERAIDAVNSSRREDILVWRYKREKNEELKDYAEALIDFAANFVPSVREGAMTVGLLPNANSKKKYIFSFGRA
jgi:MinD-like ATPase involved in chromosome partitioning or flagellar assembly